MQCLGQIFFVSRRLPPPLSQGPSRKTLGVALPQPRARDPAEFWAELEGCMECIDAVLSTRPPDGIFSRSKESSDMLITVSVYNPFAMVLHSINAFTMILCTSSAVLQYQLITISVLLIISIKDPSVPASGSPPHKQALDGGSFTTCPNSFFPFCTASRLPGDSPLLSPLDRRVRQRVSRGPFRKAPHRRFPLL